MSLTVTVCELPDNSTSFDSAWDGLVDHNRHQPADIVVLNEVPFDTWFGTTPDFDQSTWDAAVERHIEGIESLRSLGCHVIATAPSVVDGCRHNQAFTWSPEHGRSWWRRKTWIPDEAPVYEASWYQAANDIPDVRAVAAARVGILTCTEIWAMDWAKQLGQLGAQLIATPRATGADSLENWIAAGRVAAVTAGAYSVSSNRSGNGFGGAGWIIDPGGNMLALTTAELPYQTVQIDLDRADHAKTTYPRYALWTERWRE